MISQQQSIDQSLINQSINQSLINQHFFNVEKALFIYHFLLVSRIYLLPADYDGEWNIKPHRRCFERFVVCAFFSLPAARRLGSWLPPRRNQRTTQPCWPAWKAWWWTSTTWRIWSRASTTPTPSRSSLKCENDSCTSTTAVCILLQVVQHLFLVGLWYRKADCCLQEQTIAVAPILPCITMHLTGAVPSRRLGSTAWIDCDAGAVCSAYVLYALLQVFIRCCLSCIYLSYVITSLFHDHFNQSKSMWWDWTHDDDGRGYHRVNLRGATPLAACSSQLTAYSSQYIW